MGVEEAMQQLREMHGSSIEIPEPYVSAYKDWTEDPYGGGYHAWCANHKVWDVMPFMRHAFEDERVFIVGEAYSDQQGWVEGAFCVSEHIMREKFGLTCPDWLRCVYSVQMLSERLPQSVDPIRAQMRFAIFSTVVK